jgi:CspA family cold shock protein
MSKGIVKWFSDLKGYGFILDDQGQEIFVHFENIQMEGFKTLLEGQAVEFELVDSEKGKSAKDVHILKT